MIPAPKNLTLYRGDTFRFALRLRSVNDDGTPGAYIDLTGCTPLSQIRVNQSSGSVLQEFDCTILDQTNPATTGSVTITLTGDQTTGMPDTSVWDFQLTHPNGDIRTYLAGTVTATGQVSR